MLIPIDDKVIAGNLTINQLANDVLTSLDQQIAGGYSFTPQIIEAISCPDIELGAIQDAISDAQQEEIIERVQRLVTVDPQINDVVILRIEVKNNRQFYPPQGQLPSSSPGFGAARKESIFRPGKKVAIEDTQKHNATDCKPR